MVLTPDAYEIDDYISSISILYKIKRSINNKNKIHQNGKKNTNKRIKICSFNNTIYLYIKYIQHDIKVLILIY